ncbi:MAG: glycine zipper 2TM domain-containing protein [Sulfuricurvum sp.]
MKKNSFILAMVLAATTSFAEGFSTTEYIKVSSSTPLYSTISEDVPSEKCYDVREPIQNGTSNGNIIGAILGGAAGGVLGHQIGGGRGKTAATVGGAVLGTIAGQSVGSKYNTPSDGSYRVVQKCETVYEMRRRQVRSGYVNIAKLKGQEIRIESDEPLKRIPVTVTYSY